jgi:hypothetical protein
METIQTKIAVDSIWQKLESKENEQVVVVITTSEGESYSFSAKYDVMQGCKAPSRENCKHLVMEILGDGTYTYNVEST